MLNFTLLISFLITVPFSICVLVCNNDEIHELGHALKAEELGYNVIILIKHKPKNNRCIKCYKIKNKYLKKLTKASAICYCDGFSAPFSDALKIAKAGPDASKKYILNPCVQICIFVISYIFSALYKNLLQIDFETIKGFITMGFIIFASQFTCCCVLIAVHYGLFCSKKRWRKFKKEILSCPENGSYNLNMSDGSKLRFPKEYEECYNIIRNKKLTNKYNYHSVNQKLKDWGYK